jgi:polysaccharide deacetylase 2 family uncharacterized protein YibQ
VIRHILVRARLAAAIWAAAVFGFPVAVTAAPAEIAVIIDDLGYRYAEGQRAIALPGAVTLAILPHTRFGAGLARAAHASGKEVIVHLPLQPADASADPGPGALWLDMDREQFHAALFASLAAVPHAAGVNGHMGSLLTRHPGHMAWLMSALRRHGGLFFVDSYTTPSSVALQLAEEFDIAAGRRDVFLDSDPAPEAIRLQLRRLRALSLQRGFAIAIAHPYPATLEILETALPVLAEDGIRLVPASGILRHAKTAAAPRDGG